MRIVCNTSIYTKDAILKAAYSFTDRAYIYLFAQLDGIGVELTPKDGTDSIIELDFLNELLAQTLRAEIVESTADIRKLIISRALASTIIEPITRSHPNGQEVMSTEDDLEEVLSPWTPNQQY